MKLLYILKNAIFRDIQLWLGMAHRAIVLLYRNPRLLAKKALSRIYVFSPPRKMPVSVRFGDVRWTLSTPCLPQLAKAMAFGYYGLNIADALTKCLTKGSIFFDIGANIGYFSAFAMARVGTHGHVYCFEPVPAYASALRSLAADNPNYNIHVIEAAAGNDDGVANIDICDYGNIGWNTMVPGLMKQESPHHSIKIKVCRLDKYIVAKGIQSVACIKIDVEGFEYRVLQGLSGFFSNTDRLPHVICEISPDAGKLLGHSLADIEEFMKSFGYTSFLLDGIYSEIRISSLRVQSDVIFSPPNCSAPWNKR